MNTILIDKFTIPETARTEFLERLTINRNFIHTLPGFIRDSLYETTDENGTFNVVTVAVWENEEKFLNAKKAVAAEYAKQGFDISSMTRRLGMTMERGVYKTMSV
ncbi:antibiotic biosynthesis monooxygenase [Leptospira yasudae]|uniref:antibiotic biosynthesis monooxygenase family protein n=1 Tax=Leptospira yasudae TaxID=2202201 RepID=UPI001C4F09B8|nr:antibiotic biosynthesis monooxygenase family protein [Leptospira yasudae]MBW0433897.1 antibiotic biosynthesis monooxygenase [Leptospira yasudae]